jgi:LPXTG-motif cell wall-anchored protein
VQETKAPTGYNINSEIFIRQIKEGTSTVESVNTFNTPEIPEKAIRGGVAIEKRDVELNDNTAQGLATLEGAEFTITTLNDKEVKVDGKNYAKGEVVATLTTDADGIASTKKDTLPFGEYEIEEITAPKGYLDTGSHLKQKFKIETEGKIVELNTDDTAPLNQVKRGDLELIKIEDGSHKRMANVPFLITSKTTGESHIIVTDINGYASTHSDWNKHSHDTNLGKDDESGVWFGNIDALDDNMGALIYDDYIIEELACDSNKGHDLIVFDISIRKNNYTVNLGTLTDDIIPVPDLISLAQVDNGNKVKANENSVLEERLSYSKFITGSSFKAVAKLVYTKDGKPVLDDNGKQLTLEKTFSPSTSAGDIDFEFKFDSTKLDGIKGADKGEVSVTVVDEVYIKNSEGEYVLYAEHKDLEDLMQTVTFYTEVPPVPPNEEVKEPSLTSLALVDGKHTAKPSKETSLVDTLTVVNFDQSLTYLAKTRYVDKLTGKALIDKDGKEIVTETIFRVDKESVDVKTAFTFDSTVLVDIENRNVDIVSVVDVYDYNTGKLYLKHYNLEDKEQTVTFEKIPKPATPETPKVSEKPKTGDTTKALPFVLIGLVGLAIALVTIVRMRKREQTL